ncbi:MAG: acyl-CoA/acyl-ACP dehydrogenase [Pseudomonadales bacterium]|nr:acyl-CoA/acyl-ACP dehydrogenase [Pseudomonadales bacterium]
MEFQLTEEQRLIQASAIDMVRRDIQPVLDAYPADQSLPKAAMHELFKTVAEMGLMAPRIPISAGGSGLKMLDYGLIFEALPAWFAISVMAQEVTAARIFAESTPEQQARFMPGLFSGKTIAGTATSEPGAGSDPRGLTTKMEIHGDTAVVNGRKLWVSNGSVADMLAVTCINGVDAKGRNTLMRIIVEPGIANVAIREIETVGLQQGHLSEAVFEDCEVPVENILSSGGDAARMLTVTWNGNRPLVGLAAAALTQKAFDLAVEHAGLRHQFGKPIAGHQLVQRNLADIETAILSSRLLSYYALDMIDRGERENGIAAMAKRHATKTCENAISLAMQVQGGMGITREAGLEQLWRDVRMLSVPDGTDDILTLIQGREITGLAAFR